MAIKEESSAYWEEETRENSEMRALAEKEKRQDKIKTWARQATHTQSNKAQIINKLTK